MSKLKHLKRVYSEAKQESVNEHYLRILILNKLRLKHGPKSYQDLFKDILEALPSDQHAMFFQRVQEYSKK